MLPDIVTFWHGPIDALRQTCLRSQLAAGHKVTVYSFEPIPGLPDGVSNAEAEAVLPHSFAEKLRPATPDGTWSDWTVLQFSDFFRMRLMTQRLGLWLDADVLLLKPVEIDLAKPYFAWERSLLIGNSVLYLPPDDPILRAFERLMKQDELAPDWLALRHRLTFMMHRLTGKSTRVSDIRIALYGPAALTALARREDELKYALPRRTFYTMHSVPKLFFDPSDFSQYITAPDIIGFHLSSKGRAKLPPIPGSLYAWATEKFAG